MKTLLRWCPAPVAECQSLSSSSRGLLFLFTHSKCRAAVLLPADSYTESFCPRKATCRILHMHTFRNGPCLSPPLDLWGSSGLPLGLTESHLRHLIVRQTRSTVATWSPRSLAVAIPSEKKELLSAVSAHRIDTNRHGFGIALVFFLSSKKETANFFVLQFSEQ